MSLDVRLLEKVRELANGVIQARCPACAEGGRDRTGEHLRLYPDGRFGCCVHPRDREHRKRIFALAGDKSSRSFTVKIASGNPSANPARSVRSALTTFPGTLGTPVFESVSSDKEPSQASQDQKRLADLSFGTLGTPISHLRAYAREEEDSRHDHTHTYKDFENAVPSVPSEKVEPTVPTDTAESESSVQTPEILPYITPAGDLVIPFASPARYHWWKGGQSVAQTKAEALQRLQQQQTAKLPNRS
jgi:hypothetical protein